MEALKLLRRSRPYNLMVWIKNYLRKQGGGLGWSGGELRCKGRVTGGFYCRPQEIGWEETYIISGTEIWRAGSSVYV
jgi:hypothetical protein